MYKRSPIIDLKIGKMLGPMEDMGFFREKKFATLDPLAKSFIPENAWYMAELSRISYITNLTEAKKQIRAGGFKSPKFFDNKKTGTQAFIAHTDKLIVVVFRGTQLSSSKEDIKTDLDFFFTKSAANGKVHKGFKKALDSIWQEILKEINIRQDGNKKLWFTGHSLGGALATLAASRCNCHIAYTFGSPRVGNKTFSKLIKGSVYRVTRAHDIVTRVPPAFIGYRHVGDLYFIDTKGNIIENPNNLFMFKERLGGNEFKIIFLLFTLFVLRSPFKFLSSYILEHSPYNYSVFMWNNISANK